MPEPIKVFISYAKEDFKFRDSLEILLKPSVRSNTITIWHDQMIDAGTKWLDEIRKKLNKCDVIIFLISQNFLASDFIHDEEINNVITRQNQGNVIIVPLIVRPSNYEYIQRVRLLDFQALPKQNGELRAVTQWNNQDEAWVEIGKGLMNVFNVIIQKREKEIQNKTAQEAAIQAAYQKTKEANTLESWKEFDNKYPNHEKDYVKKRIHELTEDNKVFQEFKQSVNPISLIEEYLNNTKETQNKAEAKQIISHWKELMKLYDIHKNNWAEWMEQIQVFETAVKDGTWAKFQNSVPVKREVFWTEAALIISVLLIVLWWIIIK